MSTTALVQSLRRMHAAGLTSAQLTCLHHFSLKGRRVSLADVLAYFDERSSLRGNNISFAERCRYIAGQLDAGESDLSGLIDQALVRCPLGASPDEPALLQPPQRRSAAVAPVRATSERSASRRLGELGERYAASLLAARGYSAELLPTNYPTYDIKASGHGCDFLVSVKVSQSRPHVRLGSRASVSRLSLGNFVFAFFPASGDIDLESGNYRLLILPAETVRADSLCIHDTYWSNRGSPSQYSVMVKGYDLSHRAVWAQWNSLADAWHLLPEARG